MSKLGSESCVSTSAYVYGGHVCMCIHELFVCVCVCVCYRWNPSTYTFPWCLCGNRISVSGVDMLEGTPILDIKPYVAYSDALPRATCPDWIATPSQPLGVRMEPRATGNHRCTHAYM
jgi:hypothetical protein